MRKACFLIMCAVLLLFSACANRVEVTPEATPTPTAAPTAAPVDDGIPVATPEPTAEPVAADILDTRQPMDEKGVLSQIPNAMVESAVQQEVTLYEKGLLLYGPVAADGGPGYRLTLLSFTDGSVVKETTLTGLELPEVRVRNGWNLEVSDYSDGEIRSFYGDFAYLTEVSEHAPCGVYYIESGGFCSVAQNGIYLFGDQTPILENVANLYVGETTGNYVSIRYTDLATQLDRQAVLNLNTGEVEPLPFAGVFNSAEQADGLWLAGREDGWYLGRGNRPSAFTLAEPYSNVTLLSDPTRILVSSWDREAVETMTLYSPEGRFLSRCQLPSGCGRFGEPVWSEQHGGYFFTIVEPTTGSDRLLFWDLSVPVSGEDLTLTPAYESVPTGSAVAQTLYDRAAAMGNAYGVTVKIAEQVAGDYADYTAAAELDESIISAGLDALESALSVYPTGFMPQLLHGSCQAIEFQLTGALAKKNLPETVSGFSSFSAFVEEQEGKVVVVLDINRPGSLEQTVYHEVAHLIDNKLSFDAWLRPESNYSEENWAALNPAGFVYAQTYDAMPMNYFNDGYENYFLDIYSRTFAREDRARILEYAMIGADYVFSTPERLAKLDYLSRCIRECFDTTDWPARTPWEMPLN